ncbi:alkylation response protein AidB-like acyl-CoA dehydrogenase [Allocatelliglobosispora scoriae]|uniref:Alkylation response protein AidB-like acyl-CoA dehydrogenase n=1 Tax=Allocatelliglobosispora scoriae TaxID=643052 RepID=A0A841BQN9_9ACTN|nr:acyl-CoA dehydrogenase family protein [Allocatelliglobosispora scoriae]MBB5870015.1 alkylation response protein AidB-like acyl-CoA dehydrogenase [Allocatelliglobosispora scoriae]
MNTCEKLTHSAGRLIPLLKKHAAWSEENRRLHDEVIEGLADAGIFKMRTPKRYGGHESPNETLVDVAAELGRGDGSAAWTASVYWIPTWMAGLFPDHVQDEVFATPDVRVCGTLTPSGMATPVPGGIKLSGRWSFISGAWHAQWQEVLALRPTPDGGMEPIMALVPMSQLQIIDDWFTAGVRGSGSVSTVADDLFVPAERVLSMTAVMTGQYASELNAASPVWRVPLPAYAAAASVGTMLGLARAASETFFERLPSRKITYTAYDSQAEAPVTHLRVAEAAMKTDEAEFHAYRVARLVDEKGASGAEWSMLERVRSRLDVGAVCQLATEAIDVLARASGGSSIYSDVPIQRIARDIHVIGMHALIHPETGFETYGRVLSGLEPNSLYV